MFFTRYLFYLGAILGKRKMLTHTPHVARVHENVCRPLDACTFGPGRAGSQSTGEGPQGAMMDGLFTYPPFTFPVSFGLRGQHIKQRYSSGFSPTGRHALHFLIIKQASKQARNLMRCPSKLFLFFTTQLSWQASRQAGRQADRVKAGIVHYFTNFFPSQFKSWPDFFYF
jgi:hypothetical protein